MNKYVIIDKEKRPLHSLDVVYSWNEVKDERNVAVLLQEPIVVIDVDDPFEYGLLVDLIRTMNIQCSILKTDRGGHFYFRSIKPLRNSINTSCLLGLSLDIKSWGKKSMATVKLNGIEREWLQESETLDEVPPWLLSYDYRLDKKLYQMGDGDGRNNALFCMIIPLIKGNMAADEMFKLFKAINTEFFIDPLKVDEIRVMTIENKVFDSKLQVFFDNKTFLHNEFATWIAKEYNIHQAYSQLYIYEDGYYKTDNRLIEQICIKEISTLKATQRREVIEYLNLLDTDVLDPPPFSINIKNGIYDFKNDILTQHSYNYFMPNRIPVRYDKNVYCKITDELLNRLFTPSLRLLVEEMLGYILFDNTMFQKAFILLGAGGNGKSTFLNMLTNLFGRRNCSYLSLEDLENRFRPANLVGKVLNLGDDISEKAMDNSPLFKSLVTSDIITLEKKGKDSFDYSYRGKLIFTSNTMLRATDKSEGLVRRLIFIPFVNSFKAGSEYYDPHIDEKLDTDRSRTYLLNVAIRGAQRLLENNGFSKDAKSSQKMEEFKLNNNSVLLWLQEGHLNIAGKKVTDSYTDYKLFCASEDVIHLGKIKFSAIVKSALALEVKQIRDPENYKKRIRVWTEEIEKEV